MTDKADHLIERAAALLRSASLARGLGVDSPPAVVHEPVLISPHPLRRAELGPTKAASPSGFLPMPLLVPPNRSKPLQDVPFSALAGAAKPGQQTIPTSDRAASAAEIPASPSRPVISLDTLERAGLVVARTKRTRASEEYRIVIGRILRALHEEPDAQAPRNVAASNVLLVTSARPGEGKSFTALNLAGSIAQNTGESVLLVDVDPKIRPITDQLGLGESLGFLDLIARPSLSLEELVRPTVLPNLSILPLGSRVESQADGSAAREEGAGLRPITPVIHLLAERFPKSLIMLDAPPCLSTSDPHTLAAHVGQVVMVVEAERTQRSEVEAALELVRVCPTITMLLNKVRLTTSHTFGAYDYFGSYT